MSFDGCATSTKDATIRCTSSASSTTSLDRLRMTRSTSTSPRQHPTWASALREHFAVIRPATDDVFEHIQWYMGVPHKERYIAAAQRVLELVQGVPHTARDTAHELMVQQARQVVFFYTHFSLSASDALRYRETRAAENLRWWHEFSEDKIAYWAASAHTANAPDLRIADPPTVDMRLASVGSFLRQWYGRGYVSIGFTFDHGTLDLGDGQQAVAPRPATGWFERPLGDVELPTFIIDLRVCSTARSQMAHPATPDTRPRRRRSRRVHGRRHAARVVRRGDPSPGRHSHPSRVTDGGAVRRRVRVCAHG